MRNNNCDIGTLASYITDKKDIIDPNIVKVHIDQTLKDNNFFLSPLLIASDTIISV